MSRFHGRNSLAATLAALAFAAGTHMSQAKPATPREIIVRQPDGEAIRCTLKGDEFVHWYQTQGGYAFVRNPSTGLCEYATLGPQGLRPTGLVVGAADPAASKLPKAAQFAAGIRALKAVKAAALRKAVHPKPPYTGTKKMLAILVNFADTTTTYTRADFNGMMNTVGYAEYGLQGSVKDYFKEVSYGACDVEVVLTDWVKLPKNLSFYAGKDGTENAAEMIRDACVILDQQGFDFKALDLDGDGIIDVSPSVIHEGGDAAAGEEGQIWSHAGELDPQLVVQGGAVKIPSYHTEPEKRDNDPLKGLEGPAVFCHEMGHAIFDLDDLYDTSSASEGVGEWCIMGSGTNVEDGIRPPHYCAYFKQRLGWATVVELTEATKNATVPTIWNTSKNAIFKISSGMNPKEFLLIENRQLKGFDDKLPGAGLLLWHVDESLKPLEESNSSNADRYHYMVGLVQADGKWDLENSANAGDAGDPYPGSTSNRTCGLVSTPNSDSYWGKSGISIEDISDSGDTMSFSLDLQAFIQCATGGEFQVPVEEGMGGTKPKVYLVDGSGKKVQAKVLSTATDKITCAWTAKKPAAGSYDLYVDTKEGDPVKSSSLFFLMEPKAAFHTFEASTAEGAFTGAFLGDGSQKPTVSLGYELDGKKKELKATLTKAGSYAKEVKYKLSASKLQKLITGGVTEATISLKTPLGQVDRVIALSEDAGEE